MRPVRFHIASLVLILPLAAIAVAATRAAGDEDLRTWTSHDGKHTTEAVYTGLGGGKVHLRKADGKRVEVPILQLSDEDQTYVRQVAVDDPQSIEALQEQKVDIERNDEGRVEAVSFPRSGRLNRRHIGLLGGLPNLQRLSLVQVRLAEGTLEEIENLWGLRELDLTASGIGDPEVRKIVALKNIEVLNLADNAITNRALTYLKDLPRLTELTLANTRVGDNGIENLEELKQLKKLNLSNTRVSPQGVRRLRKALPNTSMEGSGVVRR
jgi:Leucine-rich repeat (LRR) protein